MEFLPDSKKFKILELSNATFIPSGYGTQSKGMLYDWLKHYNVRQLSNYGVIKHSFDQARRQAFRPTSSRQIR